MKKLAAIGILSPALFLAAQIPNLALILIVILLLGPGLNTNSVLILLVLALLGALTTLL